MRVDFPLDQICGRSPKYVGKLFKKRGLDPERPYKATVSFDGVTIEQDDVRGLAYSKALRGPKH